MSNTILKKKKNRSVDLLDFLIKVVIKVFHLIELCNTISLVGMINILFEAARGGILVIKILFLMTC